MLVQQPNDTACVTAFACAVTCSGFTHQLQSVCVCVCVCVCAFGQYAVEYGSVDTWVYMMSEEQLLSIHSRFPVSVKEPGQARGCNMLG